MPQPMSACRWIPCAWSACPAAWPPPMRTPTQCAPSSRTVSILKLPSPRSTAPATSGSRPTFTTRRQTTSPSPSVPFPSLPSWRGKSERSTPTEPQQPRRTTTFANPPPFERFSMKSKLTTVAAFGVAAVLALSGCGGGGNQESADGKVTLKMAASLTNPTRTEVIKTLLAGFEKENPNIKVDLISPPTDSADQKIQQMLQSGKGIDLLEARDITVGSFGANKWIYDM